MPRANIQNTSVNYHLLNGIPKWVLPGFLAITLALSSGCTPASYSGEKLKEAISDITKKEYGIDHCEVKIVGTTLGVFLPLEQLFSMDFKEAILSGKVTNMEQLFQPTEEAVDRIEDMLFSMSRVMLSTDKKIDFYYLQATDVEKTGMELDFIGQCDDIKKVRFWDIPRSEYRKRMIHEIQLNKPVLWHKPVRHFFEDLNTKTSSEVKKLYLKDLDNASWEREFFFTDDMGHSLKTSSVKWELLDIRSLPLQDQEVVVYAKVSAHPLDGKGNDETRDYLFLVALKKEGEKITRVIPMNLLDQMPKDTGVPMSRDMVYDSLDKWDQEFSVPDMSMGEFLALQLTRRVQALFSQDERIYNTFSGIKAVMKYVPEDSGHFTVYMNAPLKDLKQHAYSASQGVNEDVIYAWELATREIVTVLHSYGFNDWEYLVFNLTQAPSYNWKITRDDAELFRRKKKFFQDVLTLSRSN